MSTDKGRYSRVSRRIWNDAGFRKLTQPKASAGWLFLRLLTGPELSCIPGLFQAWDAGLAAALGWALKDFRKAFGEVEQQGLARADWKAGLVWLPKAIAHNEPENPNVVLGWRPTWAELPDCELKSEAERVLMTWCQGRGTAWADAFGKVTGNPSRNPSTCPLPKGLANQEQEQEQEQEGGPPTLPPTTNPSGPPDLTNSTLESLCPLNLAEREGTKQALSEWQRKSGASSDDCRAAVDEFVTYWTIGAGAGQKRNRWLSKLRGHLKSIHEQGRLVGLARKNLAKTEPEPDSGGVLADIQRRQRGEAVAQ